MPDEKENDPTATIRVEVRTAKKKTPTIPPAEMPLAAETRMAAVIEKVGSPRWALLIGGLILALAGAFVFFRVKMMIEPPSPQVKNEQEIGRAKSPSPEVVAHSVPPPTPEPGAGKDSLGAVKTGSEINVSPESLHAFHDDAEKVGSLVGKLNLEGYDISPITKNLEEAGRALNGGNLVRARKLLNEARDQANSKENLKRPRPPGGPEEIQTRIGTKMQELQRRLGAMTEKGRDVSAIHEKMNAFQGLLEKGEVRQAETLLDEALGMAE
jgi:hypothetical protein